MRTIKEISEVNVGVKKDVLLEDKYLSVQVLSEILKTKEEKDNLGYKKLRNKMYNSLGADKYNTIERFGMTFIDTEKPMKNTASLKLSFSVEA
jgi:hypothetical protein